MSDYLLLLIYSVSPILLYAGVIFLASPYKAIKLSSAVNYLIAGIMSALSCLAFHKIFPEWSTAWLGKDPISYYFYYSFITVAFLEEGLKFILFKLFSFSRGETNKTLLALVFNYTMVGAGFALAENVIYGFAYGEAALISRAFSAVVAHMVCGLFVGYFIALGQISNIGLGSELANYIGHNKFLKSFVFSILGVSVAIFFHGLYDFNLFYITENYLIFQYLILAAGLFFARRAYYEIRDLDAFRQRGDSPSDY